MSRPGGKGREPLQFTTLKKNSDFRRLYARGRRVVLPTLVIYLRRNKGGESRVGFTVSAHLGHAVVRNRVRRRLREIYRLHKAALCPGLDMVVVARGRSVDAPYRALERDFLAGCARLSALQEESK